MDTSKGRAEKLEAMLSRIVNDPNIIPGIHNYCDRWCERCTHSIHCSVFKMETSMEMDYENLDTENQKFWDHLGSLIHTAAMMLQEKMKDAGIDPTIDTLADTKQFTEEPFSSKAVIMSKEYTMDAGNWLEEQRDFLIGEHEKFNAIGGENPTIVADTIDVIQHYFMIIATKTYRAHLPFESEEDSSDAMGSAKVALILIDRSTAAWVRLMELYPGFEDTILEFLRQLTDIKKLIQERFPNAMSFVRPGFDE